MNKSLIVIELNKLDAFRNDLLSDSNPTSVEDKLRWYLKHFSGLNIVFGYDRPIIRGRICSSIDGYKNINDLCAPPPEKTNIGRMNEKGMPMFYAAYHIGTAIAEINAKSGDVVHIAQFNLPKTSDNGLRCLVIGEAFNSFHGISSVTDSFSKEIRALLEKLARNDIKSMLSFLYMDALSSELLNDVNASKNNYLYSRTFSRLLLETHPYIDGIIYPSAKIKGTSNIVLRPNTIHKKVNIISSQVVHIKKTFPYGICDVKVIKEAKGNTINGDIIWQT